MTDTGIDAAALELLVAQIPPLLPCKEFGKTHAPAQRGSWHWLQSNVAGAVGRRNLS